MEAIGNRKSQIINLRVLPLTDAEREVLRPRKRPSLLDWMESRYMLSGGTSAIEGPWSREYAPYFVQVCEWLGDTTTREIWVFACAQSGKTTVGTGFVGWICECSPAPTLLIMPTKPDVQNRVEARIRPMFAANSDLLRHVQGRVKNIFIGKQTVMDHMILYIGWPTTAEALADKPVCYIVADETGKYPAFIGEEADPISLMRKRQRWFKGRSKLLAMTTPVTEGDMSDAEWRRGDCCQLWVPCPHCHKWHRLDWFGDEQPFNVVIDRKQDKDWYAESVYRQGKHARYVCPKCGAVWNEEDRWQAVCGGRWVPGDCRLSPEGELIGEIIPREIHSLRIHALMLHPMVESVTNLAVEFVAAQRAKAAGNIQPLKDFYNSQLALPWREEKAVTEIEKVKTHVGQYPRGKVPAGVQMLTAGLDVQLDHVFLRVLGWGYLGEWWSIFEQRIETGPTDRVENLEKVLPYLTMRFDLLEDSTKVMRIAMAAIDRQYNADQVDAFCVRCLGVLPVVPVAGDDKLSKQMWAVGKTAGGRINLYRLNVTAYKDALYRGYFEATVPGAGYGHLHGDTPYEVLQHLSSEEKVIDRVAGRIKWIGWRVKEQGRANHYWDCDVYARAAAEIAGLWTLSDPNEESKQEIKPMGRPIDRRPIRTKY